MSGTVQRGSAAQPDTIIPIRSRGPLVLVVDLETLAGGKQDLVTQLSDQLRQRPHTSIIYAAPARSLNSARTCIEVLQLPSPDVLVVDQGASVQAADQHAALDVLDATIGARWPGAYAVRTRVAALDHMLGEHRREDALRMTYFPQRDPLQVDHWSVGSKNGGEGSVWGSVSRGKVRHECHKMLAPTPEIPRKTDKMSFFL